MLHFLYLCLVLLPLVSDAAGTQGEPGGPLEPEWSSQPEWLSLAGYDIKYNNHLVWVRDSSLLGQKELTMYERLNRDQRWNSEYQYYPSEYELTVLYDKETTLDSLQPVSVHGQGSNVQYNWNMDREQATHMGRKVSVRRPEPLQLLQPNMLDSVVELRSGTVLLCKEPGPWVAFAGFDLEYKIGSLMLMGHYVVGTNDATLRFGFPDSRVHYILFLYNDDATNIRNTDQVDQVQRGGSIARVQKRYYVSPLFSGGLLEVRDLDKLEYIWDHTFQKFLMRPSRDHQESSIDPQTIYWIGRPSDRILYPRT